MGRSAYRFPDASGRRVPPPPWSASPVPGATGPGEGSADVPRARGAADRRAGAGGGALPRAEAGPAAGAARGHRARGDLRRHLGGRRRPLRPLSGGLGPARPPTAGACPGPARGRREPGARPSRSCARPAHGGVRRHRCRPHRRRAAAAAAVVPRGGPCLGLAPGSAQDHAQHRGPPHGDVRRHARLRARDPPAGRRRPHRRLGTRRRSARRGGRVPRVRGRAAPAAPRPVGRPRGRDRRARRRARAARDSPGVALGLLVFALLAVSPVTTLLVLPLAWLVVRSLRAQEELLQAGLDAKTGPAHPALLPPRGAQRDRARPAARAAARRRSCSTSTA